MVPKIPFLYRLIAIFALCFCGSLKVNNFVVVAEVDAISSIRNCEISLSTSDMLQKSVAVGTICTISKIKQNCHRNLRCGRGGGEALLSTSQQKIIITQRAAMIWGIILSFNSGYINGCCLSGGLFVLSKTQPQPQLPSYKQSTAAVTGAWTISALHTASSSSSILQQQQLFPSHYHILASYIFGSFVSSFLNPNPQLFHIGKGSGAITFLLGSILLLVSSRMASTSRYRICFILATIVNGMQNSYTSIHTGNLIRSTHFSGISSDIGSFVGQIVRGNYENIYKLKLFLLLVSSFWFGGYISFYVTNKIASQSLLVSSMLYLLIGMILLISKAITIWNWNF